MTREKRAQLRRLFAAAIRPGTTGPYFYVALGDEQPPASCAGLPVIRCERIEDVAIVASALVKLEELLDDVDHLEDELRDATEELETWRRTYQ